MSKDTKLDWLLKVLDKENELIIMILFPLVSSKDSFYIILALKAHYDLELHKMDVKTVFLNSDLHEDVHMSQS